MSLCSKDFQMRYLSTVLRFHLNLGIFLPIVYNRLELFWGYKYTLDESHRTETSEIVQQLKVFPRHSEAYLHNILFINTLFGPIFSFLCSLQCSLNTFNCQYNFSCHCMMAVVECIYSNLRKRILILHSKTHVSSLCFFVERHC